MNLHEACDSSDQQAIFRAFLAQRRSTDSIWDHSEIAPNLHGGYMYRFGPLDTWTHMNLSDQEYWITRGRILLSGGEPEW